MIFLSRNELDCPSFGCAISSMAAHNGALYLIGGFRSVFATTRDGSAAVSLSSRALLSWTLEQRASSRVWSAGSRLLVRYSPPSFGSLLVGVDPITGGLTGWRAHFRAGQSINDVLGEELRVLVGGDFRAVGGVDRPGLAAVRWPDGAPLDWTPPSFGAADLFGARSMVLAGSRLFVASGRSLMEIDADTAALRTRSDAFDNPISVLELSQNRLFVAGYFRSFDGQPRSGLASFAISSPRPTLEAWAPDVSGGSVLDLVPIPGAIVISGEFTAVNGEPRTGLAAVDSVNGDTLPAALSPGYRAAGLDLGRARMWVSGQFGSQAFDYTGAPTGHYVRPFIVPFPFRSSATEFGDHLYVSTGVAAEIATGLRSDWTPDLRGLRDGRWMPIGDLGLAFTGIGFGSDGFLFFPRVASPGAVGTLVANVVRNTLHLSWQPADGATSYVVQIGSVPGASDLATIDTGSLSTSFSTNGPDGVYYVRVRARGDGGIGSFSNELLVALGQDACVAAPAAPIGLTASVAGNFVSLQWSPAAAGAPVARYIVDVSATNGGVSLVQINVGLTAAIAAAAPAGTYFVRVRAENACGSSAPTNEIRIAVP